jgi:hypothetical protein
MIYLTAKQAFQHDRSHTTFLDVESMPPSNDQSGFVRHSPVLDIGENSVLSVGTNLLGLDTSSFHCWRYPSGDYRRSISFGPYDVSGNSRRFLRSKVSIFIVLWCFRHCQGPLNTWSAVWQDIPSSFRLPIIPAHQLPISNISLKH